jgi:hypothetical protein
MISVAPATALAGSGGDEGEPWYFHAGGYIHYRDDEDYEGPPWFVGVEYGESRHRMFGFSVFNNSFGQVTQYAYLGKTFHPIESHPGFRFKLTGGIAHGYGGEHHKTLPLRWGDSWGVAIVPTVGYQWRNLGGDIAILSASGLLFLVGYEFP